MAVPNHLTEAENAAHAANVPVDPFAVDFFGGAKLLADEDESFPESTPRAARREKPRKKSDWYKSLPRVTNREAEFSNLLANLPENLTAQAAGIIGETLARYTLRAAEAVECSIVSAREVNLNQALQNLNESPTVFLTVREQTENAALVAALNTEFAGALIDSILDGQSAPLVNRRNLSPIETTIVEFLAGSVLNEINKSLGGSLLFLHNADARSADFYEPFERGAEIVLRLRAEDFEGYLNLLAPPRFLRFLDKSQNAVGSKRGGRKKLSDFEKIARELNLRLQIGMTFLDADSLSYLEPDDIVLIEQPLVGLQSDYFAGNLQLLIGSGANFRVRGGAETMTPDGGLHFRIEEILSEETRRRFTPAKFKMDEKENDLTSPDAFETDAGAEQAADDEAADEQISPSLENVQVALRVEIAGNKISLRELQNLRAGQIIALGTSPHDPVRLVAENNEEPVATGELIEIEGQLGVRLTKVFI